MKKKTKVTSETQTEIPEREKNSLFKNGETFVKSIKLNYIFWIVTMCSLYIITKYSDNYSYSDSIVSFILAMIFGYLIHYVSHAYDFKQISERYLLKKAKKNGYYRKVIGWITYVLDFHDKVHHDSKVNKTYMNIVIECIENFITQTTTLLLSEFTVLGINIKINKLVVVLWGLLYVTVHNINYNIQESSVHIEHHKNVETNYFPDILDILFDTKHDNKNIENINMCSINIIVLTVIILYCYVKLWKRK